MIYKLVLILVCFMLFSCTQRTTLNTAKPIIEISEFVDIVNEKVSCPDSTQVFVYNLKEGLKIEAYLEEDNLQAKFTTRDTTIYLDPCFEVFIDPLADGLDYYEFEINAKAAVWDLKLRSSKGRINAASNIIDWHIPPSYYKVEKQGTINNDLDTDLYWQVELMLPWSSFSEGRPEKGSQWAFNFMRIDYDAHNTASYWVWQPTRMRMIHVPNAWPIISF